MDIWVMDRAAGGEWGEPRNLWGPVNTTASEWFPTVAANGTLYFGSDRPGGLGNTDLYRARSAGGKFAEPENLGPAINSAADEYEGWVAAAESFLVFMPAGRPDSLGGGDLYLTYQRDGNWTPARNLGPKVNGPGLEISPSLSPDGKTFFYSSARKAGGVPPGTRPNLPRNDLGDIYRMERRALHEVGKVSPGLKSRSDVTSTSASRGNRPSRTAERKADEIVPCPYGQGLTLRAPPLRAAPAPRVPADFADCGEGLSNTGTGVSTRAAATSRGFEDEDEDVDEPDP